jgi:predicted ArsR family transcriptional regulator
LTYFTPRDYLVAVKSSAWRDRLLKSTAGQILSLLRRRDRTVEELSRKLGLTDNAVRAQLVNLQNDGFVVRSGTRRGSRKPHVIYAVTRKIDELFPKSYGHLVDLVLGAIKRRLATRDLRAAMREVGRQIAVESASKIPASTRRQRIDAAILVLSQLGGEAVLEKQNGVDVIRGRGCPIAAATAHHPEACLIAESLLSRIIGARVKERCQRGPQPSCCFEIS